MDKKKKKNKPKFSVRIKDAIKKCAALYFGKKTAKKRKRNAGDNGNVAIIKHDGLGDFILFMDAAKELRRFYAGKKITLFCGPMVKDFALQSGCFDEVHAFTCSDFYVSALKKTYKKFSGESYDVLLHPTQPRNVESEILAHWLNAKEKIASLGEAGALPETLKKQFDTIYDKLIDTGERNMTLVQTANFIRGLGDTDYKISAPRFEDIRVFPIALPENFFIIFLGGSAYNKLWFPERYYAVATYIAKKTGWKCVICGSKIDRDQKECFEKQKGELEYISLVGETTLQELIYVISRAKLVVGNDTCAIHMASAAKVPSVVVRGQFSGDKFYPYTPEILRSDDVYPVSVAAETHCKWCTLRNGGYFCLHGDYEAQRKVKCLARVTVEDVVKAVDNVIEKISKDKE